MLLPRQPSCAGRAGLLPRQQTNEAETGTWAGVGNLVTGTSAAFGQPQPPQTHALMQICAVMRRIKA